MIEQTTTAIPETDASTPSTSIEALRRISAERAILDENGYPADEVIDLIPTWSDTPRSLVEQILEPIFTTYGVVWATQSTPEAQQAAGSREPWVDVRLVTGGWSGCEEAIEALCHGGFWARWWTTTHRGGRYDFEIPLTAWDTPMGDWPATPDLDERERNAGRLEGRLAARSEIDEAVRPHLEHIRSLTHQPLYAHGVADRLARSIRKALDPIDEAVRPYDAQGLLRH